MSASPINSIGVMRVCESWLERVAEVNRELWLLLSMFLIAGLLNWLVSSHGVILGLYTLPTLFSAYVYGRRHAVFTAVASILLVVIIGFVNPTLFLSSTMTLGTIDRWFDITVWGGLLTVTAYAMGSLYERKEAYSRELRGAYFGVLTILQQFISNDKYTHNHSHRVALYASIIADRMGFDEERIDDIRAAALLHDIGKLETNRDILYKAANLTPDEIGKVRKQPARRLAMLDPAGGSLRRILPIILVHQEKYGESTGAVPKAAEIPVEARVLAVADAYDTLTSDRPYRRAVTQFEAKEIIVTGSGTDFDPEVVEAFVSAFQARQMDLPEGLTV